MCVCVCVRAHMCITEGDLVYCLPPRGWVVWHFCLYPTQTPGESGKLKLPSSWSCMSGQPQFSAEGLEVPGRVTGFQSTLERWRIRSTMSVEGEETGMATAAQEAESKTHRCMLHFPETSLYLGWQIENAAPFNGGYFPFSTQVLGYAF